jgi:phenylacetate-CoA ligase
MVVIRGVNVYPSAVESLLREFPEVKEYQARCHREGSMAELTIVIEVDGSEGDSSSVRQRVAHALESSLALRVRVELAPGGSLPRFEMKARRWVVEI